jgi:hypothetical protein
MKNTGAHRRPLELFPVVCTARDRLRWDARYRRRNWYAFYRPLDSLVFDVQGVVFGRWRYGALPMEQYPGGESFVKPSCMG